MNAIQKIYREIRPYMTRAEARYAAPRLFALSIKFNATRSA